MNPPVPETDSNELLRAEVRDHALWQAEHDGRINVLWKNQHDWNEKKDNSDAAIGSRLNILEKRMVAHSLIGAAIGSVIGLLVTRGVASLFAP